MGAVAYVLENGSLAHRRLSEVGGFKGAAAERNGSSVHSEDEEDCRRYLCFLLAVRSDNIYTFQPVVLTST
jgi:hypothetical protein